MRLQLWLLVRHSRIEHVQQNTNNVLCIKQKYQFHCTLYSCSTPSIDRLLSLLVTGSVFISSSKSIYWRRQIERDTSDTHWGIINWWVEDNISQYCARFFILLPNSSEACNAFVEVTSEDIHQVDFNFLVFKFSPKSLVPWDCTFRWDDLYDCEYIRHIDFHLKVFIQIAFEKPSSLLLYILLRWLVKTFAMFFYKKKSPPKLDLRNLLPCFCTFCWGDLWRNLPCFS